LLCLNNKAVFLFFRKKTLKLLKRIIQLLYCLYVAIVFIITILVAFPFFLVSSLFKQRTHNFNYTICTIWARLLYVIAGIQHKEIKQFPHDANKPYVFVANHSSYLDILAMLLSIHQPFRVLGKYEMSKIPVFGFMYKATVIMVDRSCANNRAKSTKELIVTLQKGISVFIFPEGTFNETNEPLIPFYNGAFKIAIETQTPIKPLLFVDSLKRLHHTSITSLTPGISRVIYLEEIKVEGLTMNDLPQLKQHVHDIMQKELLQYQ